MIFDMRTMEAIAKRFANGDMMLILRILPRGRRVRIYDEKGKEVKFRFSHIDICTTEKDHAFLREDYPLFYEVFNRHNRRKREKKQALEKLYA